MESITIISATNRYNSMTRRIAEYYYQLFSQKSGAKVHFLSLEEVPFDILNPEMYEEGGQSSELGRIQDRYFIPSEKFVFVLPEYNGGIPGIFKLFIDAISIRRYKDSFHHKKACLVGISSGRAGNLRGMEYLTGVLNYLKITVLPNKLPISQIEKLVDREGNLKDIATRHAIEKQVDEFLAF